jgi:hypothetical protein
MSSYKKKIKNKTNPWNHPLIYHLFSGYKLLKLYLEMIIEINNLSMDSKNKPLIVKKLLLFIINCLSLFESITKIDLKYLRNLTPLKMQNSRSKNKKASSIVKKIKVLHKKINSKVIYPKISHKEFNLLTNLNSINSIKAWKNICAPITDFVH